jgi:hypothetical protein
MASTPLMPIFKLIPTRGMPYVPVRPLQAPGMAPKKNAATPAVRPVSRACASTNQLSS